MVISAPSISAAGSPARNRWFCVPIVAAATGTPSCAADRTASVSGCLSSAPAAWAAIAPTPEREAEQDQPGVGAEVAYL